MSDNEMEIVRKRRPRVHTTIRIKPEIYGGRPYMPSGTELTLTRQGIEVFGWFDQYVGIESWFMSWEEFDREREALK